ncbi:hypothetical protein [Mesorhizobium sp. B2-4-17]|uniref:hypothetical protein n=1 Tax=Mesorhizobium sp. B2-4-17 TaxID=2589932 RepID=UPI001129EFC7|nr:hypothetical protein [Mesorhizobium sp. B2-4-17]TPK91150.1 hypothetical protein FJ548_05475 [Mesorhizobium sp. B2-4-17]
MPFERDGSGNILPEFDDWDELTDEEKLVRGNRLAAIAILDRLRFDLETMDDKSADADRISRSVACLQTWHWDNVLREARLKAASCSRHQILHGTVNLLTRSAKPAPAAGSSRSPTRVGRLALSPMPLRALKLRRTLAVLSSSSGRKRNGSF